MIEFNKVEIKAITQGKKTNQNDDFVFGANIKDTCALGVLGDFQTGCMAGIGFECTNNIKQFFDKNKKKWLLELTKNTDIIIEVAEYINEWLRIKNRIKNKSQKSRTTLIVLIYDSMEKKLYYTINGDSGLAVVKNNEKTEYISKGDIKGSRSGAGSLPIDHSFNLQLIEVEENDIVFAFSDGLWSNTNINEKSLANVIFYPNMTNIVNSITNNVINKCAKNDDMSFLLLKIGKVSYGNGRTDITTIDQKIIKSIIENICKIKKSKKEGLPFISKTIIKYINKVKLK